VSLSDEVRDKSVFGGAFGRCDQARFPQSERLHVVENLPPPQRAVAVAVIAGNGHSDVAARLAANIDRQHLPAGALALIAPSLR
jgi:hypothetical protein